MKLLLIGFLALTLGAQPPQNRLLPGIQPFVSTDAPVIALVHVRVIDGTGAAPAEDQTIIIDHGKIAAVDAAHKLGIKVTGHLCSIGFREAAAIGIDNLEHGIVVDTEFDPGKKPDECPSQTVTRDTIVKLDMNSAGVQQTIRELVQHNVAITSTLAVFDAMAPHRPPLDQKFLDVLTPQGALTYMAARARASDNANTGALEQLKKEMQFEYNFVKAGGHLMAGVDPTGNGGAMAGFGDLRNLELLVEAEFTPVQAVKIATYNGAKYLNILDKVGTIAPGKQADLVLIQGNPAARVADVHNVKMVFKDGVGYDPDKLIRSVAGQVGLH